MTVTETMMPQSTVRPATWRNDAALGLAGALLALCLHALAGFPTLAAANGDNDSLLRLVEIRDLIGGQGWFDLHQYRMGPQGGFVMHWSRLVDAPIAAIILVVSAFTGKLATGETVALFAWTTPLMAAALAFMLRIARAVGGEWALLPAFIICTAALHFGGVFAPGDIDHHNVQLTLCFGRHDGPDHWTRSYRRNRRRRRLRVDAGRRHGDAALRCRRRADRIGRLSAGRIALEAAKAAGFGMGLAGGGLAAFVATVPASSLARAPMRRLLDPAILGRCDYRDLAWQWLRFLPCSAAASAQGSPRCWRSVSPLPSVAVTAFPQCLADPYAGLDPRLQQFWLEPGDGGAAFLERAHPATGSRPPAITSRPSSR